MSFGNIIVGQSGGPTSAINSSLAGVFSAAKKAGIKKIYGMKNGIEGLINGDFVELGEILKDEYEIELLKRTPSSFLGSCRFKLPSHKDNAELYKKLFELLKKLDISCLLYIGGNDSMDTIMKLSAYASEISSPIRFIGVPKTIDNDLAITDHTPGYGSAAKYIAASVKEIICDSSVYDLKSVTVIEIMGRNAGWLAASSVLAKSGDCPGPDLIYLPEKIFDMQKFTEQVREKLNEKNTVIVAVSEGIKTSDGKYVCESNIANAPEDAFGHKILCGTAVHLANYISSQLNVKSRGIELSTLQRCASHISSLCDINEAFEAGAKAVSAAISGETGKMVIFSRTSNAPYSIDIDLYDINKIANAEKAVPDEYITSDGSYVTDSFAEYARPLIMGELSPIMDDGVPMHIYLNK